MIGLIDSFIFNGIEVREGHALPEFMTVPNKKHKHTKSKGMKYHERIQKKWNKRFGFTRQRTAYMVGAGIMGNSETIIAHKNTIRAMKLATEKTL